MATWYTISKILQLDRIGVVYECSFHQLLLDRTLATRSNGEVATFGGFRCLSRLGLNSEVRTSCP